ncbi:HlyD family efflux transporter periplasmic adaptor subunit [Montanilutibacter psychrotolerans]|uniref:HlyD family efflux transporter periplasmic adaptor subunit n=1 Tax=Montanilutibacter psychrotolerans TaxID=1327343 RepID=A0A3M8SX46_9GAMM|nr:HlyD family efflux transporter periplasmic adaptor subunit [Lysobacter psychrotolerans]RNF83262.1 HlyD family efflux transporter periplasmic adaptor subunit [Lysobacter psychrotolerans]
MDRTELFRKESVAAQRDATLGAVSISQPIGAWWVGLFLGGAAIALIAFLFLGEYTRRTRVVGVIAPDRGVATILAPVSGVITEINLEQGNETFTGKRAVVVSVPGATSAAGNSMEAIARQISVRRDSIELDASSQREMLDVQMATAAKQRSDMGMELRSIESEIEASRAKVEIARALLSKLSQLREGGYVSELQIKDKELELIGHTSALSSLNRQGLALRRDIAGIEQTIRELPLRRGAQSAGERRDLAELDQEAIEAASRREVVIQSPADGVVSVRFAKRGEAIQMGAPILSILQKGSTLEAELTVPTSAIGFMSEGDRVRLRYEAFPYQKFGQYLGTIRHVGRSSSLTTAASDDRQSGNYKVVVELDSQYVSAHGKRERLMPGMRVQADILGEQRRLIEWLFEPLFSLRENVSAP